MGEDYNVFRSKRGGYFVILNQDSDLQMEVEFRKCKALLPQLDSRFLSLDKAKVLKIVDEVGEIGWTTLAKNIKFHLDQNKSLSVEEFGNIFSSSGEYVFDSFRESPYSLIQNRHKKWGKFSNFIDQGKLCAQCSTSNTFFAFIMGEYFAPEKNIVVENRSGFLWSGQKNLSKFDFHRQTRFLIDGIPNLIVDATVTSKGPIEIIEKPIQMGREVQRDDEFYKFQSYFDKIRGSNIKGKNIFMQDEGSQGRVLETIEQWIQNIIQSRRHIEELFQKSKTKIFGRNPIQISFKVSAALISLLEGVMSNAQPEKKVENLEPEIINLSNWSNFQNSIKKEADAQKKIYKRALSKSELFQQYKFLAIPGLYEAQEELWESILNSNISEATGNRILQMINPLLSPPIKSCRILML